MWREERRDDKIKRDGESEEPKDDEQQNHSTPYQTTPQHVWNSVDDFFSSSGLTQLSPWVLQAKHATRRRSAGSNPVVSPFARRSASRFASRGAHLTSAHTPECRSCSLNSIRSAESGYLLDISLFRIAALPRLSVYEGITTSFVLSAAWVFGKKARTASNIADASTVAMTLDAFPSRRKTQGNSSSLISSENQYEHEGSGLPSRPSTGSHPPTPVRSSEACASTRGALSS